MKLLMIDSAIIIFGLILLVACERRSERELQERRRQEAHREEMNPEFAPSEIKLTSNWFRFENKEVVCYEANRSGVWCYRKEVKNEDPSN